MLIVAIVIIALLKGLSLGTGGTLDTKLKTSALNLARTQLEYVKAQSYNKSFSGNLSKDYGLIPANAMSDTKNFSISGSVQNVSASCTGNCLQKITVNVSYSNGSKTVQVSGYKNPDQTSSIVYTYNTSAAWAWERAFCSCEYNTNHYPASPDDYFRDCGCGCAHTAGLSCESPSYKASNATLAKVVANDSSMWETEQTDVLGEVNTQLYKIKIAQDRRDISNIQVTWVGHGSQCVWFFVWICYPTEVKIYKSSATNGSGWYTPTGWNVNGVTQNVTWVCNLTYPGDYIDSTGNISILAATEAPGTADAGLYTNYIALNVTVAPVPIALAPQDDGINPLPYLAEAPFNNPLLARNTEITYQYNISMADLSVERQ